MRSFSGKKGPFRDIVLLNAAAAFIIAGEARSAKARRRRPIRSMAAQPLEKLIAQGKA
jgi:anthranilate phosphoribosyltransferase